jgi:hypothetical protein
MVFTRQQPPISLLPPSSCAPWHDLELDAAQHEAASSRWLLARAVVAPRMWPRAACRQYMRGTLIVTAVTRGVVFGTLTRCAPLPMPCPPLHLFNRLLRPQLHALSSTLPWLLTCHVACLLGVRCPPRAIPRGQGDEVSRFPVPFPLILLITSVFFIGYSSRDAAAHPFVEPPVAANLPLHPCTRPTSTARRPQPRDEVSESSLVPFPLNLLITSVF